MAIQPNDRKTARALSEALLQTGKFEEAHALLTSLTTSDPGDKASWARLGFLSHRNGYYPAALIAFDHALKAGPGSGTAADINGIEVLRSIALVETGAFAEAGKIQPVLLARPENAKNLDLRLSYLHLLYETGRYDEALTEADRVLAIDAANAAVHFWRALLFQRKGDISRAIAEAERSRELAIASPAPRGLLVRLYQKSGRNEDAAREAAWLREHEAAAAQVRP